MSSSRAPMRTSEALCTAESYAACACAACACATRSCVVAWSRSCWAIAPCVCSARSRSTVICAHRTDACAESRLARACCTASAVCCRSSGRAPVSTFCSCACAAAALACACARWASRSLVSKRTSGAPAATRSPSSTSTAATRPDSLDPSFASRMLVIVPVASTRTTTSPDVAATTVTGATSGAAAPGLEGTGRPMPRTTMDNASAAIKTIPTITTRVRMSGSPIPSRPRAFGPERRILLIRSTRSSRPRFRPRGPAAGARAPRLDFRAPRGQQVAMHFLDQTAARVTAVWNEPRDRQCHDAVGRPPQGHDLPRQALQVAGAGAEGTFHGVAHGQEDLPRLGERLVRGDLCRARPEKFVPLFAVVDFLERVMTRRRRGRVLAVLRPRHVRPHHTGLKGRLTVHPEVHLRVGNREGPVRPPDREERFDRIFARVPRRAHLREHAAEALAEQLDHDLFLAAEVLVENGGAVLDLLGHPPDRDRRPALRRGDLTRRVQDRPAKLLTFPLPPLAYTHD